MEHSPEQSGRHKITDDMPSTRFVDSFLAGNGWLGATFKGGRVTERIDLNVDTLWSGGPHSPKASIESGHVSKMRAAIASHDHAKADDLARQLMCGEHVQAYQPAGWIEWTYNRNTVAEGDYLRTLDLASATVSVDDTNCHLESFVSAPDGVLVSTTTAPSLAPTLHSAHPVNIQVEQVDDLTVTTMSGRVPSLVIPSWAPAEQHVFYSDEQPDDQGLAPAGMAFVVVVAYQRLDEGARIIASAESGFRGVDAAPIAEPALLTAARERTLRAARIPTADLVTAHQEDYSALFDRIDLDLGGSVTERYFDLGRYLLISGSRPGTTPLNLQGIWNVDVAPPWNSNFTTNINLEMNYWGAEAAALPEMHLPLLSFVRDLEERGRSVAADFYEAEGSCAHHNTDIWGFAGPIPGLPQWGNWPSALYWLAAHTWQHRAYQNKPSPEATLESWDIHRSCTQFILSMLVEHSDGSLVLSPSTSPEQAFLESGVPYAVTWGSAMDQELAFEVLSRLLILSDDSAVQETLTPGDQNLIAQTKSALKRLRPPTIKDGYLLEWADDLQPEEVGHRHLSHLYGLFPGSRIHQGTAEYDAVRKALQLRLAAGSGYTGWSQSWVLALAGKLRDTKLVTDSLATLTGELSSRSLLDLHPVNEDMVFQIDGNLGAVAGILNAIATWEDTSDPVPTLTLLPALPQDAPSGRVRGLRLPGGHSLDMSWKDGKVSIANIHGESNCSVRVVCNGPESNSPESNSPESNGPGQIVELTAGGSTRLV